MNKADQSFIEQYKPVVPPEHFDVNAGWPDKVLFALSQLGEGTVAEVAGKLLDLQPQEDKQNLQQHAEQVLSDLYNKGLIKGNTNETEIRYNLSKITEANTGGTDPDLL